MAPSQLQLLFAQMATTAKLVQLMFHHDLHNPVIQFQLALLVVLVLLVPEVFVLEHLLLQHHVHQDLHSPLAPRAQELTVKLIVFQSQLVTTWFLAHQQLVLLVVTAPMVQIQQLSRHLQAALLLQLALDLLIHLLSAQLAISARWEQLLAQLNAPQVSTVQLQLSSSMSMHAQRVLLLQQEAQLNQVALTVREVSTAGKVILRTTMQLYAQLKATFVPLEINKELLAQQDRQQRMESHVLLAQLTNSAHQEYQKLDVSQVTPQQEISVLAFLQPQVK